MDNQNSNSLVEYLRSDMFRGTKEDYKKYINLHKMNVFFYIGFIVSTIFFYIIAKVTNEEPVYAVVPFVVCGAYVLFAVHYVDGRNIYRQIGDWMNLDKFRTLKDRALISHSDKVFTKLLKAFDKALRKGYNKTFHDIYIINTNPQSMADTMGNSFWLSLAAGKRMFAGLHRARAKTNLKIIKAFTYVAQKNPTLKDYYGF